MFDNDAIKAKAGGDACWTFIGTSIVLFLYDGGLAGLFSVRALAFIGIGMFVAAFVVGWVAYQVSRLIVRRLARGMSGDDFRPDSNFAKRAMRIGRVMRVGYTALAVGFTVWVYGSFFWWV